MKNIKPFIAVWRDSSRSSFDTVISPPQTSTIIILLQMCKSKNIKLSRTLKLT